MFFRLPFILICFFLSFSIAIAVFSSSSYEDAYNAFVYEDYARAIELFNVSMDTGEREAETVYYLGESYLRFSLVLIGNADYKSAAINLTKAKSILESALNNKSFYAEYRNYLKTLKGVNEALYVVNDMEEASTKDILLYISLFSAFLLLIFTVLLIIKIINRRRASKKVAISDELKDLVKELNTNFFKTKEMLKEAKTNELASFIEATEVRCIMLNDQLEEAIYGLRDIDEESFKVEIEDTKDRITEFLSGKSVLLTKS